MRERRRKQRNEIRILRVTLLFITHGRKTARNCKEKQKMIPKIIVPSGKELGERRTITGESMETVRHMGASTLLSNTAELY